MKIQEIVICSPCTGMGKIPNHSLYEIKFHTCELCKGSGRLLKTMDVNYSPYDGQTILTESIL